MRVDWDPAKAESNFTKHGVAFEFAARSFRGRLMQWHDVRRDYGEERWCGVALIDERFYFVAFTIIGPEHVRLITARRANARERKSYWSQTGTP